MNERTGLVAIAGNPLTLLGDELKLGDRAPDFTALDNDLNPASLSGYAGKKLIISAVPSLDTAVCDIETRRFNAEASKLPEMTVLTISMDLPFAQKRWCGAAGIDRVITLSDHRDASFGLAYGVLIKELRLLARCVFAVDSKGFVRYIQLLNELTSEPDYDAALKAASMLD